jgi:hypothetical protein
MVSVGRFGRTALSFVFLSILEQWQSQMHKDLENTRSVEDNKSQQQQKLRACKNKEIGQPNLERSVLPCRLLILSPTRRSLQQWQSQVQKDLKNTEIVKDKKSQQQQKLRACKNKEIGQPNLERSVLPCRLLILSPPRRSLQHWSLLRPHLPSCLQVASFF